MARNSLEDAQRVLREAFASRTERMAPNKSLQQSEPTSPVPTGPGLQGAPNADPSLLEATFNQSVQKLLAALGGRASVTSGRRTPERQQQLWDEALRKYGDPEIADNWVARPGTSRHEQGIANDLSFADDSTRAEAHRIAGQYGLYFPMSNEPWHVEPVSTRRGRG